MDPTLGITLHPGTGSPLYQQIFDAIVDRIRNGALPEGFRVPPTRTLASTLGTTRNTVVRAFGDLTSAGWLESVVGRGTFVRRVQSQETSRVQSSGLAWSGVLSTAATSEALTRATTLSMGLRERPCIDTSRLQPAPELLPVAEFRRCMNHVLRTRASKALSYVPVEGVSALREQLCADLVRQGVGCRPEDVVVTSGSQQALDLIGRTLIDPGDTVLVEPETYSGVLGIFRATHASVTAVAMDSEGPAIDALDRHRGAKALYLMPNGQNPTGAWIGRERRAALVQWSRRAGVPLIEDDYAADLDLDGLPMPPALRALDGDVLHVSGYSKRLIPALRIGLVVCPEPFRRPLLAVKRATELCGSAALQYALAEFLDRGYLRAHLERVLPEYRARRAALVSALHAHLPDDFEVHQARRGVSVWVTVPEGIDPIRVFVEAQRAGVRVKPGALSAVRATHSRGFRMTFCTETPSRLTQAAERLGRVAHSLSRHPSTSHPLEGP